MIYKRMAKCLTQYLIKKNMIAKENHQLITYCMERKISEMCNLILLILIGLLLSKAHHILLFISFYSSLRRASGGYHATTHSKCITGFTIYMFFGSGIAKLLVNFGNVGVITFLMWIITFVIVTSFAPVGCENKVLTDDTKYVLRKKSLKVLMIQLLIYGLLILKFNYLIDVISILSVASLFQSFTLLPIRNEQSKLWLVSKKEASYEY